MIYRVYGLACASDWPLTGSLVESRDLDTDVVFRRSDSDAPSWSPSSNNTPPAYAYRSERLPDGRIGFTWPGLFQCVLSPDGSDVAVRPLGEGADQAFTTHLFGHVLSFVLLKKGIEPLHATVLARPGGAIGILGDSGYGKSTLAAALIEAGLPLLTDDLLVLRPEGDDLVAQPGLPRLKLWPEAAARFMPGASSEPMAPGTRKRIYPLEPPRWTGEPSPLSALYLLRRPVDRNTITRVTVRNVPRAKAIIEITRNTFNSVLIDPDRLRGQFRFASDLATRVPVRSLTYPPGHDRLPHVVERLLHDAPREG